MCGNEASQLETTLCIEKKLGNSLEEAKNENLIELMGYNKSSSKKAAI